ncbi:aldo/keto reductase [Maribacter sp.]|uniref:aldo/keto reductase n=1 Tax=Maribacter sp. TaxID=1897614 RepID=UPI0025B8CC51|nr:aldo/keto reductase [Maribacter sp.]
MIELQNLSKIGIGTYRMTIQNDKHKETLEYAVDKGINLIDTASNYIGGDSERLVGDFVKKNGRDKIFIITKAGYIHGNDILKFSSHLKHKGCIKVDEGFYHSFHKSFLKKQINASLERLNVKYIDGFLIHNPEYYLKSQVVDIDLFYEALKDSLLYLETLVDKGIIRYYGISSNDFPTFKVDLRQILKNVEVLPNFRLLQFPYNFIENQAVSSFEAESLIELCKKHQIKAISNRPLNTTYKGKVLRLADYSKDLKTVDFQGEEPLFNNFIKLIMNRIKSFDPDAQPLDFFPLKLLIQNRTKLADPETVGKVINQYLAPFLKQLNIKENHQIFDLLEKLNFYWCMYAKKQMTEDSKNLRKDLVLKKEILDEKNKNISLLACEKYMEDGIEHVLMGLREKNYVDSIKKLI